MNIAWKPVKNFTKGRSQPIKGICIHIAESTAWQVYQTFNSEPKSSHYLVLKNGDIWQFCREQDTAWTQGFKDRPTAKLVLENIELNPNDYLLGIEHEGFGYEDISPEQYQSTSALVKDICARRGIPLDRIHIIRHHEINAGKTCPGRIDVDKIIQLAQPDEIKIEELKKVQLNLLQRILVELQKQLKRLLGKL